MLTKHAGLFFGRLKGRKGILPNYCSICVHESSVFPPTASGPPITALNNSDVANSTASTENSNSQRQLFKHCSEPISASSSSGTNSSVAASIHSSQLAPSCSQ